MNQKGVTITIQLPANFESVHQLEMAIRKRKRLTKSRNKLMIRW